MIFIGGFRIMLCRSGALDGLIVHLGECSGHQVLGCSFNPVMHEEFPSARDFSKTREFFPFIVPPETETGRNILQACNAMAAGQKGASGDKLVGPVSFSVTLGVDTRRDPGNLGTGFLDTTTPTDTVAHGIVDPLHFRPLAEYSKTASFPFAVNVACAPLPQPIRAPPEPFSVNVQVEQKGTTCPKQTDVTAIIKYREPITTRFRFKVDGKYSELITIKARKIDGGKPGPVGGPGAGTYYLVKRLKTYHLDPGRHRFRVELESGKGKKSEVNEVKIDCPPFAVNAAWLKYKVSETATCPKKVWEEATFHTTRPGWVNYQIRHQGGLGVAKGKARAKRQGMQYVATAKRTLTMNSFEGQFMADVTGESANSGWVPLKVDCLKLGGGFSFLDKAGPRCPREGRALVSFSMNMPVKIRYALDCNVGHFTGVARAVSDNKGGYVAPALVRFDIKKTKQVKCALKSVSPINRAHALKGHLFRCVKSSGISGPRHMKPETRPHR